MKRCPTCNRSYTDDTLRFCLEDGAPLVQPIEAKGPITALPAVPPPTLVYGAAPSPGTPAWTPTPSLQKKRKVWPWVVGALVLVFIIGVGFILVLVTLASLGSNPRSASSNSKPTSAERPGSTTNSSPREQAAPNAPETNSNVEIKNVYMARDNGSGEPGDQTETFSPSDRTLHCIVELDHAQEGTTVKFNWIGLIAGDMFNQSIKELEYTTKPLEKKVHAQLTLPKDWPEGFYKVDVYLNGRLARTTNYQVE
jgi:hypothetical protein